MASIASQDWLEKLRNIITKIEAGKLRSKAADTHLHSLEGQHWDRGLMAHDIVRRASMNGYSVLSVTDHNTLDGTRKALLEAQGKEDVCAIPGMEMDALGEDGRIVHIVALGIDPNYHELVDHTNNYQEAYYRQYQRHYSSLSEGKIDLKTLLKEHKLPASTETFRDAVRHITSKKFNLLPIETAIGMIHRGGGVAMLPHPILTFKDIVRKGGEEALKKKLDELVAKGLDGIEVIDSFYKTSPAKRKESEKMLRRLAKEVGKGDEFRKTEKKEFLITGGSGERNWNFSNPKKLKFGRPEYSFAAKELKPFVHAVENMREKMKTSRNFAF